MTKIRGLYLDNRLDHLDQALAVANSPDGGTCPVGTIIQLVPARRSRKATRARSESKRAGKGRRYAAAGAD